MENKKWAPSQEENLGVITSVYEFIKEELSELQKETGCPDSFIYDFIGKIQNEWHPESCHSIVRNKKRKNQKILNLQLKFIKLIYYNLNLKILKHDYQNTWYRTYPWYDCILWFSFDWAKQPLVFSTFKIYHEMASYSLLDSTKNY